MGITTEATVRLNLMMEIASQMSDEEFNSFIAGEKARRNATMEHLNYNQRVRFVVSTRPARLAGATGKIIDFKFYAGEWSYKIKMDDPNSNGETFIRVKRSSIEVIDDDAPFKYAKMASRKARW